MKYVAGWDGGGTKTLLKVLDIEGNLCFRESFGPLNYNSQPEELLLKNFENIVKSMEKAGGSIEAYEHICIATAGIQNPQARVFLEEAAKKCHLGSNITIIGDHEAAFEGALKGKSGTVLISGTGSVCYGRNDQGEWFRAGGWGHLFDDQGSGYSIGRELLSAAVAEYDGRLEGYRIYKEVLQAIHGNDVEDIISFVYNSKRGKEEIAALSSLLEFLCSEKYENALFIAEKESEKLLELVKAVVLKGKLTQDKLALTGGVLSDGTFIKKQLLKKIAKEFPEIEIVKPVADSAQGAAWIALKRYNSSSLE